MSCHSSWSIMPHQCLALSGCSVSPLAEVFRQESGAGPQSQCICQANYSYLPSSCSTRATMRHCSYKSTQALPESCKASVRIEESQTYLALGRWTRGLSRKQAHHQLGSDDLWLSALVKGWGKEGTCLQRKKISQPLDERNYFFPDGCFSEIFTAK